MVRSDGVSRPGADAGEPALATADLALTIRLDEPGQFQLDHPLSPRLGDARSLLS
jgi:hypothetical protein